MVILKESFNNIISYGWTSPFSMSTVNFAIAEGKNGPSG